MTEYIEYICGKLYQNPDTAAACTPWVLRSRCFFEAGEMSHRDDSWRSYVVIPPPEGWTN